MQTEHVIVRLDGQVTHPVGNAMIEAAIKSLSPQGFLDLMTTTANQPPTPAQLVTAVEAERHVART